MAGRLVRSKALENWRVPGAEHQVRELNSIREHLDLLQQKITEESGEVIGAMATVPFSPRDLIEEFGDLISVMQGLAEVFGLSWKDVERQTRRKNKSHGTFGRGALVWDTDIIEGPEWDR